MITLKVVADEARLKRLLNPRRTKAWSNAALRNPPIDGIDTYTFFMGPTSALNFKKVTDAILTMQPWAPLVQNPVSKPLSLREAVAQVARASRRYTESGRPCTTVECRSYSSIASCAAISRSYTSAVTSNGGSRIYTDVANGGRAAAESRIYTTTDAGRIYTAAEAMTGGYKLAGTRGHGRAPCRYVPRDYRRVNQDTRVDHARQLALKDTLLPVIEKKLTRIAVAYVQGRRMEDVLSTALSILRGGSSPLLKSKGTPLRDKDDHQGTDSDKIQENPKYRFTKTLDMKGCFDNVAWHILDGAIDRHLSKDVDHEVRELLKRSYRAPAFERDGTKVERTEGLPQGAVLAPLLINLYFADFDKIVRRTISNFGCILWRYSDDILVAAPSVEALQHATAVIQRELQRLRMTIKSETDHVCDLANPENPGKWLGFAFTSHRTWVPRERVERKAASLLDALARGKVTAEMIDDNLTSLHQHHVHVLHEDDATKAIRSIRKLVAPYLHITTKRKEGIEHVRKQIERKSSTRRSKPAPGGDEKKGTTLVGTNPDARDRAFGHGRGRGRGGNDPAKGRADGHGEVLGEARTALGAGGTPPVGGGFVRDGRRCVEETHAVREGEDLAIGGPNTVPLAAPKESEAPHLVDQAAHRRGGSGKDTRIYTATIKVAPSNFEWGELLITYSDGSSWTSPFRVKRATSQEEIVLAGYRLGIPQAVRAGAQRIAFAVEQPTIEGYLHRQYRIGSVYVMRQWEWLLREVDNLREVEVGSTDRSEIWSSWSVSLGARATGASRPV